MSPLKPSRRSNSQPHPHKQSEIESAGMDQQTFQNVAVTPQVHPAHSPGFIQVRVHTLEFLASLPLQALAALAPYPSPVPVDCTLFALLTFPTLPSSSGSEMYVRMPDSSTVRTTFRL